MSEIVPSISDDAGDESQDLFEIEDYYIASDLEGLIVLFENLLKEWKPFIVDRGWNKTTLIRAQISVEVEIIISGTPESDPDHPIALLNIPLYINLTPRISSSVGNEARYVLSAACMAAFATGIDVPFIATCNESFWVGRSLSYCYQVEVLDWNIPDRLTNLSGILSVFYDLKGSVPINQSPMISVEYAYESQQFEMDLIWERNRRSSARPKYPLKWGCSPKRRLLMRLLVRWTSFPEGTFTSNSFYTELDPITAPVWQLSCQLDPKAKFQLSSNLERFLSTCDALSEYSSLTDIIRRDHSLFSLQAIQDQALACFHENNLVLDEDYVYRPTKSCPYGSLLSNLVICMMQQYVHEPYRIVQLYFAFVDEICRRWDEGTPLTGLKNGEKAVIPDLHCCLLYQKLQVLDYCIRLRSSGAVAFGRQLVSPVIERARHWADFDYDDLLDDVSVQSEQVAAASTEQISSGEVLPEGVNPDITLPDVFLLDGVTKMNVPITLESPLLTEDQIEEQQELMAGLGTDQASTAVRAEMQSPSLLSDMSAFKAANPGAKLGDFVRWYSPNDWIDGKGLSKRMSGTDNFWKRCWTSAPSCPASRQKPLFDYVVQGELILDYFKTISPSLLLEQISAIAVSSSKSIIADVVSSLCSSNSSNIASNLVFQKSDIPTLKKQIKEAEEASELLSRLSGGILKQSEIDSIIRKGSTTCESERQRVLDLVRENSRSLGYPDHRLFIVSAPCINREMQMTVQLDGGSLVTTKHASKPSQIIFCSTMPL